MLYSIVIHFFAGVLTGSIFRAWAVLGLAAGVLVECGVVAFAAGWAAGLWALTGLAAIQAGYLGGIYLRGRLERAGIAQPDAGAKAFSSEACPRASTRGWRPVRVKKTRQNKNPELRF